MLSSVGVLRVPKYRHTGLSVVVTAHVASSLTLYRKSSVPGWQLYGHYYPCFELCAMHEGFCNLCASWSLSLLGGGQGTDCLSCLLGTQAQLFFHQPFVLCVKGCAQYTCVASWELNSVVLGGWEIPRQGPLLSAPRYRKALSCRDVVMTLG